MNKIFLWKNNSFLRALCLFLLVIGIYILNNSFIVEIVSSEIYNYIVKPILWGAIAVAIYFCPPVRYKGKIRLKGFINWWAFNFAFIFIFVQIGSGCIDGFGKSPYNHSLISLFLNFILLITSLIGIELFRHYVVNCLVKEENYYVFILTALFITLININLIDFYSLKNYKQGIQFIAETISPEFSKNLFATYLVFLGGPIPSIIYLSILQFFHWFSPILPDLKWITNGFVGTLCPLFSLIFFSSMYVKESREKIIKKKQEKPINWVITAVISITLIWFSVGVFPIFPSVIATGSMRPLIQPGDVTIVKKVDVNNIKMGEIIQYKSENILISHRVIKIVNKNGQKMYITKGDNNSVKDFKPVKPNQIKGKIIYTIPKIGLLTLMFKSKDIPLEKVEF